MQFMPSYLLGLNELVGQAYVQNLGLLMKLAPGLYIQGTVRGIRERPTDTMSQSHLSLINILNLIYILLSGSE